MNLILGIYLIVVVIGSLYVADIADRGCDWQELLIALALLILWPLCVAVFIVLIVIETWYQGVRYLKSRGIVASEKDS